MSFFRKHSVPLTAVAVFVVAFIVFAVFVFKVFPSKVVFAKYQVAARQHAEGKISLERLLDYSPLYLYLNSFARKFFSNPYTFLLWFHVFLAACSSVFLFLLLRRFFSLFLALLGTAVFITSKSVILYTRALEPEPLSMFLLLGALYFVTGATGRSHFFAGVFLGLSVLTRSNFFPLLVVVPFYFLLYRRLGDNSRKGARKKKQDLEQRPHWLTSTLLFLCPALLLTGILVVRNSLLTGSFTIFSMNPGPVFFEGNNPNSWGESATYPPLVKDFAGQFPGQSDYEHEVYRYFARRIHERRLSVPEVNAFWRGKGLNFIVDHPMFWLKRVMAKINFIFNNHRRHDLSNVYWNDRGLMERFFFLPFAVVSGFALVGMLVSVRRWREWLLIYAALFLQFAAMVVFYVSDRQRVVIISLMIFFAAAFLDWAVSQGRSLYRGKGELAIILLLFLVIPLFIIKNDVMSDEDHQWERYRLSTRAMRDAVRARKDGRLDWALEKNVLSAAYAPWLLESRRLSGIDFGAPGFNNRVLARAARMEPETPSGLFDLGVLLLENGKLPQAKQMFSGLAEGGYVFNRQYSQSSIPGYYLARVFDLEGDKQTARKLLESALERNPGDPWVLAYLALLTGNAEYEDKLVRYFDKIDARFFMGREYLKAGKYGDAVACFSDVTRMLPVYRRGYVYLALAYGGVGDVVRGVEAYRKALALGREPLSHEKEILQLFRGYVAREPGDGERQKLLQTVTALFGAALSEPAL